MAISLSRPTPDAEGKCPYCGEPVECWIRAYWDISGQRIDSVMVYEINRTHCAPLDDETPCFWDGDTSNDDLAESCLLNIYGHVFTDEYFDENDGYDEPAPYD